MKLRVEHAVKRYGAVTAVNDLTFSVEDGETFALVGPNGAGKTTTLRMILGLSRPDAGRIEIGEPGLPPHAPEARRRLGYVPQRVEFPHGRTVAEVLGYFAELRALPREAVTRALERVGLEPLAARRASELSGGYTQRLSLAQALLGEPDLLVLDEPTASLDAQATWEFRALVQQLRREGCTVLLCSHLLAEVERVADRALILVEGRLAALERMDALRAKQAAATRLAVELRSDAGRATELLAAHGLAARAGEGAGIVVEARNGRALEALELLRAGGLEVRGFELMRPSLEEAFMEVVRGGPGR